MTDQQDRALVAGSPEGLKEALRAQDMAITVLDEALASKTEELSERLAGRYPVDYFRRAALTLMRRQPDVAVDVARTATGRNSFREAVMQAADAGLPFVLGRYYLVPFREKGLPAVQGIIGYQGLVDLVTAPGTGVTFAEAAIVYERDYFDWQRGSGGYLRHREWIARPDMTEEERAAGRGKRIAVWARVVYSNGQDKWDVMSAAEVEDIRQRAPSARAKSSPWLTDPDEMYKKTALRRLCKTQRVALPAMTILDQEDDYEYRRGMAPAPSGDTQQSMLRQRLQQRLEATETPAEEPGGTGTPPEAQQPSGAVAGVQEGSVDKPAAQPKSVDKPASQPATCGATVADPGTGELLYCTKPPHRNGDHSDGQHDWPR